MMETVKPPSLLTEHTISSCLAKYVAEYSSSSSPNHSRHVVFHSRPALSQSSRTTWPIGTIHLEGPLCKRSVAVLD